MSVCDENIKINGYSGSYYVVFFSGSYMPFTVVLCRLHPRAETFVKLEHQHDLC